MYELSTALNELHARTQDLVGTHAYRYKHFVDGSPLKKDCKYAQVTERFHKKEGECESLYHLLLSIKDKIDTIMEMHLDETENHE